MDLQRIDPDDADELDEETEGLLRRWAARKLRVADEAVARVLVEVTGGCGEGTCEFTIARTEVDLADGRVFLGPNTSFGLFIRDIVSLDVNSDGTEARRGDLWDLYDEDGRRVKDPEPPHQAPSRAPAAPSEPQIGAIRIEQTADNFGRINDRRVDVLTEHGWINLGELIATYDQIARDVTIHP